MNIKVFGELFLERDQNDPLLDHIIICIYGLLKEHISTLISTNKIHQNIYNDIKGLILECLKKRYLYLENPTYIMRNYICDCISILIISGITCSWKTCIQDLVGEAKNGNNELIFIALRSIADCNIIINFYTKKDDDNDWSDNLDFKSNEKMDIIKQFINSSDTIFEFINSIYTNINKIEKNLKNRIIKAIIDLISFWTNLNLNILTNQNIFKIIMDLINMNEDENDKFENLKSVSELVNSSIIGSKNCKLYEFYGQLSEDENPQVILQSIENNIDINEKEGINNCLNYILKNIDELIKSNNKNDNILWVYAKIFSCFIENYIFFFFDFNNEVNGTIFNLIKYFICSKKRKISWLFFQSMENMMTFICDIYRFHGVNDTQKKEFANYLMNIVLNLMGNCAYKKLNPYDYSELQRLILYGNDESNWDIKNNNNNQFYNNMGEEDSDLEDIDIKEYRRSVEQVFYCIYYIFKEGLNNNYELLFVNQIISLIDINDNNIKNNYDENNAIKLDVILLVLKSIINEIKINSSKEIINLINNYIYNLSDSIYIQNININIFIDYLLIVNNFKYYMFENITYFEKIIYILLLVSDKKEINQNLIDSCYRVISNLCQEPIEKNNFENIFNVFLDRFKKIYKLYNFKNIESLESLILSMLYLLGISQNNEDNSDKNNDKPNIELIPFINKILVYIVNDLHLLLESKNKINITDLKSGIIKTFLLYKVIFNHIHYTNSSLMTIIYSDFIPKTINDLITIFNIFPNDMDIFTPIIEFYINNGKFIGLYCINKFSTINNVFIELFKSNNNYIKIVEFFTTIYQVILKKLNKNDNNYLEQTKYMHEQFFLIIQYTINYIKKESGFDEYFIEKIRLFIDFINEVFPLLYIPEEKTDNSKNIIKNIINIFEFLINVINLFIKTGINKDLLTDHLISLLIESIFNLFNENIIKCLLLNLSNNENEKIIEQIVKNTWLLLNLKNFNIVSCRNLALLFYQIALFNSEKFCENLKQCFEVKGLFCKEIKENNYKNIHDYIELFKRDKEQITSLIIDILSIILEGKDPDCLEYYYNQLKRKKESRELYH